MVVRPQSLPRDPRLAELRRRISEQQRSDDIPGSVRGYCRSPRLTDCCGRHRRGSRVRCAETRRNRIDRDRARALGLVTAIGTRDQGTADRRNGARPRPRSDPARRRRRLGRSPHQRSPGAATRPESGSRSAQRRVPGDVEHQRDRKMRQPHRDGGVPSISRRRYLVREAANRGDLARSGGAPRRRFPTAPTTKPGHRPQSIPSCNRAKQGSLA